MSGRIHAVKDRLADPSTRKWFMRQDIAYLLSEVERLQRERDLAIEAAEHHASARGLVEHGPLLVTPEEKALLEAHQEASR